MDPLVLCVIYLKYMKELFTTKFRLTLMRFYLNINVHFVEDLIHCTA